MVFGPHINKYYLRFLHLFVLGVCALALIDFLQLRVPEIYRTLINGLTYGTETVKSAEGMVEMTVNAEFILNYICRPMIIIIVLMVVCRFVWRYCFFCSAVKISAKIRSEMFAHCETLSQSFYHKNKVGALMSLYINDLDTIEECFGHGMLTFFDALILGTMAVFKMAKMDQTLAILSLIPLAMLLIMSIILGKKISKTWDARQQAFSELSDFTQESTSGLAVVKAFVKETLELCEFRKRNKKNEDTNITYTKVSTLMKILTTLFVESVICIILGYGGKLVFDKVFTVGQLVEYIGYFTSCVWPVMAIADLIDMNSRGRASLARIENLLDEKSELIDKPEADNEKVTLSGRIEFKNLTFRFPGANYDSLKDINLTINAGESVGIIGRTGCGKTTMSDLILRTYNVPEGTLLLDGMDVNNLSIESVRANCAYVPQDNFLFSDTIGNNIAFASDSEDLQLIEEAAKNSCVHDTIIEFAEGYETKLGERGVTVSGGQKQRISIARALMKNAPILIMDDSVSAVDVDTEKSILENLRKCRSGKTTILVAHRVSTVKDMDKIVLMDEGRILACGSHDELMRICPEYVTLVELQRLEGIDNE